MTSNSGGMSAYTLKAAAATSAIALMLVPLAGNADDSRESFASVTPVWQGNTDFDNGGDFEATGLVVRLGTQTRFGEGHRGGISLQYDGIDYDFSRRTPFGGAPWGNVQRIGLNLPFAFRGENDWTYGVAPSVEWARENGADWSDSLVYGAMFSATRSFAPDKRLGLGLGAYSHIEENRLVPLVIVDWSLNERWRLVNPLPAGPAGPAGLELDYRFDNGWNVGLGAAYRSIRFRLSDHGPVRNGVGEESGVPVFLRASTRFGASSSFFVYAGAVLSGELRVENSNGTKLSDESFETAPLFGATFSTRF
ncbi:MAG TPA: hypothetical protein PLR02_09895 [Rhodocyclaceae bacterium]|nr:hypothetical protein [Rhodocyclaceae bacterium]